MVLCSIDRIDQVGIMIHIDALKCDYNWYSFCCSDLYHHSEPEVWGIRRVHDMQSVFAIAKIATSAVIEYQGALKNLNI